MADRAPGRPATGQLAGKVAVVTGAAKGIGAAIAKALAAEGAAVVVNYAASAAAAEAIVAAIADAGGTARAVQADVAKPAEVERLFAAALEAFGWLDILVNNAGIYEFGPLEAVTPEAFHRHFDINVLGVMLATRAAVARFGDEGGSVINIGSAASQRTPPGSLIYAATKGAIDTVTRVLAKELGPRRIRVNSINPGAVETEGMHAGGMLGGDFERTVVGNTPLGRLGQPGDIAPVAVFLASDASAWITGEVILVSGGSR